MSIATQTLTFKTSANNSEGAFELPPEGTHAAVLVALIDLGTTESTFNNETRDRHKLLFVWQLPNELDSNGDPFMVAQDSTWSLHKMAGLRRITEKWLQRPMSDSEEYDLGLMLGQPAQINLIEGVSGNGKKFMEVASVKPHPQPQKVGKPTVEPFAFHLGVLGSTKDELGIPDWVPPLYGKKVSDEIRRSKEYQALPPF